MSDTQTLIDGVYAWKSIALERDAEITKLKSQLEEARAKAIEECADDVEMETSIAPKAWERSDDYAAGWLDCRERAVAVIRALLSAPTEERGGG